MITTLLLAAGRGRRFGSQKLLARLADGRSVIAASVANLRVDRERLLVVTRNDPSLLEELAALGVEVVMNDRADEGMAGSLAAGVAVSSDSKGWLIALGDMPFVNPATVAAVKACGLPSAIVVPVHLGQRGHPVFFGADYRAGLLSLRGDRGARTLFERHADGVKLIDVTDPGVLRDIDFPADIL